MGLTGGTIYLDTNVFIDLVERRNDTLRRFVQRVAADKGQLFTSELTLAEALAKPVELEDAALVAIYEQTIVSGPLLRVVPVDRTILRRSATMRAKLKNKLADAIHIATAVETGCSHLLSEDRRLQLPETVVRLRALDLDGAEDR
ncbi:type II toxin-antitoxin system VapC family toxin [Aurantimonas sp. MSK8Z-1]|uniref:type II toxin-antitoxin system VapC family toxin n=1 Tax=Mangrovibrevibacter kandeliae TaxID=2968473 RepID=UPI0021192A57|nr:type II toxin-antitoxin system VapC family toxin [Aurantimonas sp. MSK8Z-1]MCW4115984.1 type II toxin-antitoxin system VapC family toxin [Aurantimonas sp. MSK8Z-1]